MHVGEIDPARSIHEEVVTPLPYLRHNYEPGIRLYNNSNTRVIVD